MSADGGYDDKHGFIRCPLCGEYAHNVVYEDFDGAWTFARDDVGVCDDGFRGAGKHRCKGVVKLVDGYQSEAKHG